MPIAMSKGEWERISRWTDANREDADVVRKREYIKYLDKTSKEMTKSWPNSLENVNKRNEEARRARLEAAEQANTKFYQRYVRQKREQQQQLMFSARDTIFKNKDAPKLLLSAVIETAIQKERQAQVKFNEERRQEEAEQKRRDDLTIIRNAQEWSDLLALRKQRRFDVNKQHQKDILEQAKEVADRNRDEYETELRLQKKDNIQADQEMAAIKDFDEKFKAAEKARILSDMKRSHKEVEERREEQKALSLMDDQLLEVLMRSKARVEQRRRKTEKEERAEKLRILEQISHKLETGDAARDVKEQAILNKAIKEKEAIAEERRQAEQRKLERFRQDRLDVHEQFLQAEARRLYQLHNQRQWDIMNRFKNAEITEAYHEHLRQEKARKIREYREEILRLWKERSEREQAERSERRYFYGELAERRLRAADNRLLTHAHELRLEARRHQRPDLPIQRAVDRYCKLYRLYPMPELPAPLQAHFPQYAACDASRPDPGYRAPEPPAHAAPPPDTRRDGLQPFEAAEAEPRARAEGGGDYRRGGRADGLQRRRDGDNTKPLQSVTPCRAPHCSCPLKPAGGS